MAKSWRKTLHRYGQAALILVLLIEPGRPGVTRLVHRGFQAMHDIIGGEMEFLGILSHKSGLDELALVYNADQTDIGLAINRAGIRGPILCIRCDELGETISLQKSDVTTFDRWLLQH